jgi:hypothetical protein
MHAVGKLSRIIQRQRVMSPPNGGQNGSAHGYYSVLSKPTSHGGNTHTITALKRWSIINKHLPSMLIPQMITWSAQMLT